MLCSLLDIYRLVLSYLLCSFIKRTCLQNKIIFLPGKNLKSKFHWSFAFNNICSSIFFLLAAVFIFSKFSRNIGKCCKATEYCNNSGTIFTIIYFSTFRALFSLFLASRSVFLSLPFTFCDFPALVLLAWCYAEICQSQLYISQRICLERCSAILMRILKGLSSTLDNIHKSKTFCDEDWTHPISIRQQIIVKLPDFHSI